MQGYIRKRGKDTWQVCVNLGRDPLTRKRRQTFVSVKGTERDAEAVRIRLLHQRDTGFDVEPGRLTVGGFLERWLKDYAQARTAPKTSRRYAELLRLHVTPVIGNIPLAKLKPMHIQAVQGEILAKGRSNRTALHVHRVLKEALGHAVRWQLVYRNAADAVEPPRPDRYEIRIPPPEDIRRLLVAADETPYGPLVYLAATTGLRLGELLGLRWRDLDLSAGSLSVTQTAQWVDGRMIFRTPKTAKSRRSVALSTATVQRLREHRHQQLEQRLAVGPAYRDQGFVFSNSVGEPWTPNGGLRSTWLKITRAVGMENLRFHDLRHAHASLMLAQGTHPKVVSERLGHATVGITLDIYSHVLPGLQREAAERLDSLLVTR
jgi:integrase